VAGAAAACKVVFPIGAAAAWPEKGRSLSLLVLNPENSRKETCTHRQGREVWCMHVHQAHRSTYNKINPTASNFFLFFSKANSKRLSISFLNTRNKNFGEKLLSNSFSKWLSKYSHVLFQIFSGKK
jgi:hypothetical protein